MRVILATTAALALASSAMAQTAPDRYGPSRGVARGAVQTASAAPAMAYGGRMLTWANKVQPAVPAAEPPPEPAQVATLQAPPRQAAPVPPASVQAVAQPPPQRPRALAQPAATRAVQPVARTVASAPSAPTARAYHLGETQEPRAPYSTPASLYDTPPPVQAASAAPPPAQRMAAAPAHPGYAGAPSRLYSLHREYGMTPDPTPTATGGGYVLIGPSGETPSPVAQQVDNDKTPDRPF